MPVTRSRLAFAAVLLLAGATAAMADNGPFGVGLPEAAGGGGLFRTIAVWQSSFYRELTGLVTQMKTDGTAFLWLCAFSFAYGVLHAAGPGHGKAIVSAYVLANRETARNGAVLAMVSALAQGVTAVALVLVAAVVLGATSIAMTEATRWLEVASFAAITGLGAWLTWRKVVRPLLDGRAERFAPVHVGGVTLALAGSHAALTAPDHDHGHGAAAHRHHGHAHDHAHDHRHHHGHDHDHGHAHHHHGHADHCDHCSHVPSPALAAGRLDWRKAWAAVAAVGARPCTGALIVLVFALSQGLLAAGVAAAFAMALGTGITVAVLTLAAVSARGLASRMTGNGRLGHTVHHLIEGVGALAILMFGLVMLGASLAG